MNKLIYIVAIACALSACTDEMLSSRERALKKAKTEKVKKGKTNSPLAYSASTVSIPVSASQITANHESITLGNDPMYYSNIYLAADWFDFNDFSVPAQADTMTFEVLVSYPYTSGDLTLSDTAYHVIRTTPGANGYLHSLITTDYINTFGSTQTKSGQFIYFRYQFRDSHNNVYVTNNAVSEITFHTNKIQNAQSQLNGWFSNTNQGFYFVDSVEFVTFDTTYNTSGKNYYLSQDTVFTNTLFYGYWDNDLHKPQSAFGEWGFKSNLSYTTMFTDATGCCEHLSVSNYPHWMSVIRTDGSSAYTFRLKFKGYRIVVHQ